MNRNWKKYNKSLARRGEIMLSFDAMKQWGAELKDMNREKEGHQYVYLHLPFRQTEDLRLGHN